MSATLKSPQLQVRLREEADFPQCAAILRRVHAASGYPVSGTANPRAFLDPPTLQGAWIAEIDGQIIGHVSIDTASDDNLAVAMFRQKHPDGMKDEVAVLGRLFVEPQCQKTGAATALVKMAVAAASERGQRLLLFALMKDQPAMRLYRRLGWQELGEAVFYWGDKGQCSMDSITFVGPSPGELVS